MRNGAQVSALPIPYHSLRGKRSLTPAIAVRFRLGFHFYTVALLSHNEPTVGTLLVVSLSARTSGFKLFNRHLWPLMKERLPVEHGRNIVDLDFDLVRHITGRDDVRPQRTPIGFGAKDAEAVDKKLRSLGVADQPYSSLRADAIPRVGSRQVLGKGPPVEQVFAGACNRGKQRPSKWKTCISGLSVHELAAVLSRARLFIGNNSGPMHVADAAGIPTLTVQGPNPLEWNVYWTDAIHKQVAARNLPCVPCDRLDFYAHRCTNEQYLTYQSQLW